jgi:hypothetical protein
MRERLRLPAGARLEELEEVMRADIASGALAVIDDGKGRVVCEPIEECTSQETANAKAIALAGRTGADYLIVVNADIDGLC